MRYFDLNEKYIIGRKGEMKRNFVRFIAIILSILLVLDSNSVEALASGLNDGNSNVNVSNQLIYEEEGYSVTFTVTSKWKKQRSSCRDRNINGRLS